MQTSEIQYVTVSVKNIRNGNIRFKSLKMRGFPESVSLKDLLLGDCRDELFQIERLEVGRVLESLF